MVMGDIKRYFNNKIRSILSGIGYPKDKLDDAVVSLSYALGAVSDEEYLRLMGGVFGGYSDLTAVENFLNNDYQINTADV